MYTCNNKWNSKQLSWKMLSDVAAAPVRGHLGRLSGFARNERGDVMIIFGLLFTVMLVFVGSAVDMGRWLQAKSQTWQALDAAVLAGARALQLNSKDSAAAAATAQRYYSENVKGRASLSSDTITFSVADGNTTIAANGGAAIDTIFLGIIGIRQLSLFNSNATQLPKSRLAIGGNSGYSVEISMMLDITGSMSGSKIDDLKSAAKNMVDIVVWKDQGEYTSRVALVPFSAAVYVGSDYASTVRGSRPSSITVSSGWYSSTYKLTNCVSERADPNYAFTDDPPSTSYVGPVYTSTGSCTPSAKIVPLTSDTAVLKAAIDGYSAGGSTAGHLGTAWAWYLLSPKWAEVWPAASDPGSYTNSKLKKIAVLMTDGEYNLQYCSNGVAGSTSSCSGTLGTSSAQAQKLCSAMKATGITVYTVGFQVNATSKSFLQQCSSGGGYYYDAADGAGLSQAFTDIALKISALYLSQ